MIFGLRFVSQADHDALLRRLEEISLQHKQDLEELRQQLIERIAELEEEIAKPPLTGTHDKSDGDEMQMVRGFVPFSKRKKEFERSHRKDGLNPTARQILRNDETLQKAAPKTRKANG